MKTHPISQRFVGRSKSIDLKKLERETQRILYLGLVVSLLLHGLAAVYFSSRKTIGRVPRPMTVEFVIQPPRMKKPFVLRKRGHRKRALSPKKTAVQRLSPKLPLKPVPPLETQSFPDSFEVDIDSKLSALLDSLDFRKRLTVYYTDRTRRYIEPMESEILSIDDLDYGKFKSLIIRDMFVKQNVSGFVYIPVTVWGAELFPIQRPVIGLAEALETYTGIRPKLDNRVFISSPEMLKFPFVYIMTDRAFELTKIEKKNFTDYLKNGGFAVIDNGFPQDKYSDAEASLRKILRDVEADIGSRAYITMIPNYHPIYHSFFDFNGPPLGATLTPPETFNITKVVVDQEYHTQPYLEGLWIGTRLAAVYSDRGYGLRWSEIGDNAPQLKFGVNLVVYALTHEGGINRRQIASLTAIR